MGIAGIDVATVMATERGRTARGGPGAGGEVSSVFDPDQSSTIKLKSEIRHERKKTETFDTASYVQYEYCTALVLYLQACVVRAHLESCSSFSLPLLAAALDNVLQETRLSRFKRCSCLQSRGAFPFEKTRDLERWLRHRARERSVRGCS